MRTTTTNQTVPASTPATSGSHTNMGNHLRGEAVRKSIRPYGAGWRGPMELKCPNCKGTDLKRVSFAYQEGLQHINVRTRLRGVVVGSDGPDVVVGRATTKGTQQTEASKVLTPPRKWSYAKLCGWSALAFLSVGWIVFYVNAITKHSSSLSSLALTIYAVLFAVVFAVCFVAYWYHNHSTYPRQLGVWDRSFICQRCGAVVEQPWRLVK